MMDITHNVVGWFEIPVADIDRAVKFYEAVFDLKLSRQQLGPLEMAWFPWIEKGIGAPGSFVRFPDAYKPSMDGVLVYSTAFSGDAAVELARVEPAGGRVLQPKKPISPEYRYMGLFVDTEGNRFVFFIISYTEYRNDSL